MALAGQDRRRTAVVGDIYDEEEITNKSNFSSRHVEKGKSDL